MWHCRYISLFRSIVILIFRLIIYLKYNKWRFANNVKTLDFPFLSFKTGYKFQIHRFITDVRSQLLV